MKATYVNGNRPTAARFMEVPAMGHTFQYYLSMADAFVGKEAPFDPRFLRLLTDWLSDRTRG